MHSVNLVLMLLYEIMIKLHHVTNEIVTDEGFQFINVQSKFTYINVTAVCLQSADYVYYANIFMSLFSK